VKGFGKGCSPEALHPACRLPLPEKIGSKKFEGNWPIALALSTVKESKQGQPWPCLFISD
jgi:hypothetical protein